MFDFLKGNRVLFNISQARGLLSKKGHIEVRQVLAIILILTILVGRQVTMERVMRWRNGMSSLVN